MDVATRLQPDCSQQFKLANDIPIDNQPCSLIGYTGDPDIVTSWTNKIQLEVQGQGLLRLFSRDVEPDDVFSMEINVNACSVPLSIHLPERDGQAVVGIWRQGEVNVKLNGTNHLALGKDSGDASMEDISTTSAQESEFKKGHKRNNSSFLCVSGAPDDNSNALACFVPDPDIGLCPNHEREAQEHSFRSTSERRLGFLRENSVELLDNDVGNIVDPDDNDSWTSWTCAVEEDGQSMDEENNNIPNENLPNLSGFNLGSCESIDAGNNNEGDNAPDVKQGTSRCQSLNNAETTDCFRAKSSDNENNAEEECETVSNTCPNCGKEICATNNNIKTTESLKSATNEPFCKNDSLVETDGQTDTVANSLSCTRVRLEVPIRRSFTELLYMCDMMDFCDHLYENDIMDIVMYRTLFEMSVEPIHRKDAKRKLLLYLSTREVKKADMIKALYGSSHYQFIPNFFPEEK